MRPAQRSRQVYRRGNPQPPDNRHLEHPHLRAGRHGRAHAPAPEKHQQERAEELPRKPRLAPASCRNLFKPVRRRRLAGTEVLQMVQSASSVANGAGGRRQ